MLEHRRRLPSIDSAIHLVGAEICLAAVLTGTLALAAPTSPTVRVAQLTGGEMSPGAFAKLTGSMDPAMLRLASRFELKSTPIWRAAAPVQLAGAADPAADAAAGSLLPLQDLSPEAAQIWNASNTASTLPNAPARPFKLAAESALDEARAIDCMTAAIYYEAAVESADGQRAVAQVVLNRVRHPAFPKTVCGVVLQGSNRKTGCQFSFTCDGSLGRQPSVEGWTRARQFAVAALSGYVVKSVGTATHYHASYVAPYWSPSLVKIGSIGAHIFYRWTGSWGLPPAFSGRYQGAEMDGLQIASLQGLTKTPAPADAAIAGPVSAPAPVIAAVELVPGAPKRLDPANPQAGGDALAEPEVLSAASAAHDAVEIIKPEDLDWAGRPKAKGPPRLALPSS